MRNDAPRAYSARIDGLRAEMLAATERQIEWCIARLGDLQAYRANRGALLAPLCAPADADEGETRIAEFTAAVTTLDGRIGMECDALAEYLECQIGKLRVFLAELRITTDIVIDPPALTLLSDQEQAAVERVAKMLAPQMKPDAKTATGSEPAAVDKAA